MAKSFLRSGSLNDILALGENGLPVYASALQLRETLRLRKQPVIADCLAIPQLNEAGDRLDWYSPREGKVVSWAAATDTARASALRQLENCLDTVSQISKAAKSSEKPATQFFGSLLEKAFRFPDQNHMYLVGGQPVLTFWGFLSLDSVSNPDPFAALRNTLTADEPLPALSLAAEKIKAPEPVATPRRKKSPLIWALPVAALVVAGSAAGWLYSRTPAPKVETAKTEAPKPAATTEPAVIAPPLVAAEVKSPEVKTPEPTPLPVAPAAVVVPSPEPVAEVEKTPVTAVPAVPVSKNALVMPPDAVKIGSTKFLNGNWNVVVDIKDPVTGKPPVLRYQFKQGQGTVKITYGAGVTCRTVANAGLMQSGNLVINSRYRAKCSDGSRYQMPEISCTQGATGAAVCQGRYTGDTVYPMTIKREGK